MKAICDFCSSPNVRWSYPAEDFVYVGITGSGIASHGSWEACDVCHGMIERGDHALLVKHSVERLGLPNLPAESIPGFEIDIAGLHSAFFKQRTGDPLPIV